MSNTEVDFPSSVESREKSGPAAARSALSLEAINSLEALFRSSGASGVASGEESVSLTQPSFTNSPSRLLEALGLLPNFTVATDVLNPFAQTAQGGDRALAAQNPPAFARDVNRIDATLATLFTQIDTNQNGFITMAELNAALTNPNLTRQQALLVAMLKELFTRIAPLNNDGWFTGSEISRQDVARLMTMWRNHVNGTESHPLIQDAIDSLTRNGARLDAASTSLYGNANNPLASIVPEACIQPTGVGNCHFVAALRSLAAINPQAIRDMIRDNGNGTYTVTFPGQTPITVPAPTAAELAHYGVGSRHGTWAAVMQMAYGRYWSPRGQVPLEGAGGSCRDDGTRMLSGRGADTDDNMFTSYDTLDAWLHSSMNSPQRRIVTAFIRPAFLGLFGGASAGFVDGHAYAVTGYTSNANDITQGVITLSNPWGYNPWANGVPPAGITDLGNGSFRMSLRRFNELFSGVVYAR